MYLHIWRVDVPTQGPYQGFVLISGGMDVVIQEAFIKDLSPVLEDGCCYGKSLYRGFISISGGWMLLGNVSPVLEDGCCYGNSLYRGFISSSGGWMLLGNVSPVLEDECYYTRILYQGFISISEWRMDVITQRACQGLR